MNTLKNKVRKYIIGSTVENELKKLKSSKTGTNIEENSKVLNAEVESSDEKDEPVEEVKVKKTKAQVKSDEAKAKEEAKKQEELSSVDDSSSDDQSSSDDEKSSKSSGSSSDAGSMKIESESEGEGSESSSSEEETQELSLAERRKKWELPQHLLPKHHP